MTVACDPAQQAPNGGPKAEGDQSQVSERGFPPSILKALPSVSLYRLYNPRTGDHFYTTSAPERDKAAAQFGYTDEGVCCQVFVLSTSGTTPLYRLYNARTGDHRYTIDYVGQGAALNVNYHDCNYSDNDMSATLTVEIFIPSNLAGGPPPGPVEIIDPGFIPCCNTLFGDGALATNPKIGANTAMGYRALAANDKGYDNTATGYQALTTNRNGTRNTAMGWRALNANAEGQIVTVQYHELIPMLLNELQRQHRQLKALAARVAELEAK